MTLNKSLCASVLFVILVQLGQDYLSCRIKWVNEQKTPRKHRKNNSHVSHYYCHPHCLSCYLQRQGSELTYRWLLLSSESYSCLWKISFLLQLYLDLGLHSGHWASAMVMQFTYNQMASWGNLKTSWMNTYLFIDWLYYLFPWRL